MKKEIKVLNVLLDDRIGGAQMRIVRVAGRLKERGIEYSQAIPKGSGEFPGYVRKAGVKVYRCELGTPHFIRDFKTFFLNINYLLNFIPSVYSLIRIIKLKGIDIIHLHGLLNFQGALAALFTRRLVVWHFHETLYPKFLVDALRPFTRFVADSFVHISEITRNYYLRGSGFKGTLIYEPVDVGKFDPASIAKGERVNLRKELNISKYDIVIGTVGNIS